MGKIRNRITNTLGIAPRTVKTAWRTTIDTTKSALNLVLDPVIWIWKTGADIKKAIHKSFTEWPRYHKLWKAPASLALSPFMAVEWVAETLRGTWVNACSSVRDIIWNTLTNEWTAIKMMGKWEKFNFSTEKLDYKKISPRNRLAGLFKPKTEIDIERAQFKSKEKDLKDQEKKIKELKEKEAEKIKSEEEKLNKEKEKRTKEKEARINERKKERESWRESKKAEQEKNNQAFKQERESFSKEKEELNKRIAILEKENKDLEATFKKTNPETIENKEKKADVIKMTPKTEKSSNNEDKEAKIIKLDSKENWKTEAKTEQKPTTKAEVKSEKKTDSKETWNSETKEVKEAA